MAHAIISSVLERIGDLLKEEAEFLRGADGQVGKVYNELEKMQELLRAGDPVGYDGNWVVDVKKIAYEAGNVVESYIFQVVFRRRGGIRNLLRRSFCFVNDFIVLKKTGSDVQVIKTKISHINDRLRCLRAVQGSLSDGSATARNFPDEKRSSLNSSDAAGDSGDLRNSSDAAGDSGYLRNSSATDIELMVSHLVSDDDDGEDRENIFRVVSIFGIGGLGKTTIARKIYNHPNIKAHFDAMSWTCISHEPQLTDILQGILIDLIPEEGEQIVNGEDQVILVEKLIQVQKCKKCLIVLDDVWSTKILDHLKPAILVPDTGTKLLLTTRSQDVAAHIDPGCFMYNPPIFNEDDSWKLLLNEARIKDAILPGEIVEIGRKIVEHCGGLPLAIKVVGRMLPNKLDTSEWKMFYERMVSNGVQNSNVLDILDISYRAIPYNLQSCFVYLGNIPEDYEIEVDKLFQLWIAENLISSEKRADGVTMMDVAEGYLKELAERSLVQVRVDEYTGRIKFCRIHDLIRELCLFKGTGEEFLQVINLHQTVVSTSSFNREIPRLAICLDDLDDLDNYVPPTRGMALHLRSVLFFLQNYNKRSKISRVVESRLTDLKLVRVLDLGGLVFSKLDQAIGKLIYLKYLGLRYTVFHELPSTIQNMSYLQTLDLFDDNTQYASIIVPNVFSKLKRLSHLYLRRLVWSNHNERLRLNGLSDLETLDNFDSQGCNVEDLCELSNLRKLGAKISNNLSHLSAITDYLQSDASKRLRQLALSISCDLYSEEGHTLLGKVLKCHILHELSLNGRTGRLPEYDNNFSETLAKLTLESCELKGNPMSTLEKLPNLQSLILKWNAFVEEKMVCSARGFPQLRILQLWRIRSLKDWMVVEGAMPNLCSLDIVSCPNLKKIPDGLQFVTTLKLLLIKWMPKAFCDRLRVEEGEDYFKVQTASIKIVDYDGKEESASKKTDVKPQRGVVIEECSGSPSLISNTPPYKEKGKAPMIEPCTESSSSSSYEDYENYAPNEMDYIWQLGYPQTTVSE